MASWKFISRLDGTFYSTSETRWQGDRNDLLDLVMETGAAEENQDKKYSGLWKYSNFLPLEDPAHIVSFDEGFTPVTIETIGSKELLLKLEYIFPTGSYKDRGATMLVSKIKELGIREIVGDSSGNAGCAIAAYAAKAGIACEILVATGTSPAKIKQLEAYGAKVTKVEGNRKDVADAALIKAKHTYYASHSWNPFFFHGTKTFAYEIAEQCRDNFPDAIVFPVGNGTLLIGAYIGFSELLERGKIRHMPAFIAVQAENCAPLLPGHGTFLPTIAEGIAVPEPVRKKQMLEIIAATGGKLVTVNEAEIESAWALMASKGYYIEKTSAAGIAGAMRLSGPEKYLVPLTGHGLKNK